jgi:hypothetical protein
MCAKLYVSLPIHVHQSAPVDADRLYEAFIATLVRFCRKDIDDDPASWEIAVGRELATEGVPFDVVVNNIEHAGGEPERVIRALARAGKIHIGGSDRVFSGPAPSRAEKAAPVRAPSKRKAEPKANPAPARQGGRPGKWEKVLSRLRDSGEVSSADDTKSVTCKAFKAEKGCDPEPKELRSVMQKVRALRSGSSHRNRFRCFDTPVSVFRYISQTVLT